MPRTAIRAAALVLVTFAVGCGSGRYPVQGKITFEGKPLKGGGAISLVPLDNKPGKAAGGEITPEGTYTLTTDRPGDGSMPGEFRVVIFQTTEREPDPTQDGEKPGQSISVVPLADRIPAIYSDAANSPLKMTVEAKSLNEINLDLKRQ